MKRSVAVLACLIALPAFAGEINSVPEKRQGSLPVFRGNFQSPSQNPAPAAIEHRAPNAVKMDGDINMNQRLDFADVVQLFNQLKTFDFNQDGVCSKQDVFYMRQNRVQGDDGFDVNQDGTVNNKDMVALESIIKMGDIDNDKSLSYNDVNALFNMIGGTLSAEALNGFTGEDGILDPADIK